MQRVMPTLRMISYAHSKAFYVERLLKLSRHAFALRLLQYVRDEAHRFAQHYHHILRKKSQLGE